MTIPLRGAVLVLLACWAVGCAETSQSPPPRPELGFAVFTASLWPDGAAAAAEKVLTGEFGYTITRTTTGYFRSTLTAYANGTEVDISFDWVDPQTTRVTLGSTGLTAAQQDFVVKEIRARLAHAQTQPASR